MPSHPFKIEFVYFDLGNILLTFDAGISCGNVADRFGVTAERVKEAIYTSGLQDDLEHGRIEGEQFAQRVRVSLGLSEEKLPTEELLESISDMFRPIDAMDELVENVRLSGRRVGLLSNTCHAHWNWIGQQNYPIFAKPFDVTVLSYEVGAMKPNPKIYQYAELMCGVDPRHILFIDDREENVVAATEREWNAEQCFGGSGAIEVVNRYLALSM